MYWGDLIYDGSRPVLVIGWRTTGFQRIPYISFAPDAELLTPHPKRSGHYFYHGDLLRTGKMASPQPAGWNEPQAALLEAIDCRG